METDNNGNFIAPPQKPLSVKFTASNATLPEAKRDLISGMSLQYNVPLGESQVFYFKNMAAVSTSHTEGVNFLNYVPFIEGAKYTVTDRQLAVVDKDGNELLWRDGGNRTISMDHFNGARIECFNAWTLGVPTEGGEATYEIINNHPIVTQSQNQIAKKIVTVEGQKFCEFPLSDLFPGYQDLDGENDVRGFAFAVQGFNKTPAVQGWNLGSWELATLNDEGKYEIDYAVSKEIYGRGGDCVPEDVNFKTLSKEEFTKSSILVPVAVHTPLNVCGAFYDKAGAKQAMRGAPLSTITK